MSGVNIEVLPHGFIKLINVSVYDSNTPRTSSVRVSHILINVKKIISIDNRKEWNNYAKKNEMVTKIQIPHQTIYWYDEEVEFEGDVFDFISNSVKNAKM
jgi:hypothetical protein